MKKILSTVLALSYFLTQAQENKIQTTTSTADSSKSTTEHRKKISHEIGVNATYLIKQLFSSSTSLSIQPYQLTYKLIKNRWAIRSGVGLNWSNYDSDEFINSSSSSYGPDHQLPNHNKNYSVYGRVGWEYRFRISRKFLAYTGIDALLQTSSTRSQYSDLTNDSPYSYYYHEQKSNYNSNTYGIGTVLGLQFYATRRLSIYAEMPLYFLHTSAKNETHQYTNVFNSTTNNYDASFSDSYQSSKNGSFSISLPATLYFAIKF